MEAGQVLPMYLDLNVASISSAAMLRAREVAVSWTSSRPTVWISIATDECTDLCSKKKAIGEILCRAPGGLLFR